MDIVDTRDWRGVRVCADLSSLPQRLDLSYGSRRGGFFLIVFGAVWVIGPPTMAYLDASLDGRMLAISTVFAVIGAGMIYFGSYGLFRRE